MGKIINDLSGVGIRYSDSCVCNGHIAVAALEGLIVNIGINRDVVCVCIAHELLELAAAAQCGSSRCAVGDLVADLCACPVHVIDNHIVNAQLIELCNDICCFRKACNFLLDCYGDTEDRLGLLCAAVKINIKRILRNSFGLLHAAVICKIGAVLGSDINIVNVAAVIVGYGIVSQLDLGNEVSVLFKYLQGV